MQVSKWGNSLAIRLPAAVVDALELRDGDDIEVRVAGARVFEVKKTPGRYELLQRLRKFRGRLPADFVFERDATHERARDA
jgi:antitoxin MazE